MTAANSPSPLFDHAEERFRLLMEGVLDYAIIIIDAEGCIIDWNAGAEQIFRYKKAEVLGRSASLIFTAEDRDARRPQLEIEAAAATGRADDERWLVRKGGTRFMASGVLSCLRDRKGRLYGFVKMLRDITGRLESERLAQKLRSYESLAVLAGGFAHDFNNLLTSILGNTSLVLNETPLESHLRPMLESAVESSRQAAALTRHLLAYAGKGQSLTRRLDISTLISEMQAELQSALPDTARLDFALVHGLPEFEGDPQQIHQAILNLVVNAREALDRPPRTVSVSTGSQHLSRKRLDSLGADQAAPGRFVYCEVADTGAGMDEETVARIFEPFFTTRFLGRGLGLAAVSGIIRQHRGAIRVSSKPGHGTVMRLFLPAARKAEGES